MAFEALNELSARERLIILKRRLNEEGATLEQLGGFWVSVKTGKAIGTPRPEKLQENFGNTK